MKLKDWLAFILLGTIWGSSFLWIKIAVQEIGPLLLVALRLLFGIFALLVVVAYNRPQWPRQRRVWVNLALLGLINNALPYTLISWGEQYIDSAVAAVLNSTTPLFTMLIAHLFLTDDHMTRQRVISLFLGFTGIVLLFSRDLLAGPQGSLLGQMAVLLASISYAFASVFARRTTRGLSPVVQALVPLLSADLLLWTLAPAAESPLTLPQLPLTWLSLIWLGVLGTGAAFLLYFYLLHSVGPTRTVLVTYIFPLVGVALGVIFLNESLDWQLMAGAVMVIASVVLVNTREKPLPRSKVS
jgi:drug/metabolite transporter (DMT)-like permease